MAKILKSPLYIVAAAMTVAAFSAPAIAGQLTYKPVNPSFGGDSFNSSHLLGIASANNDNKEVSSSSSALDNFERNITSSLLSRISSEIADQILGEDAADSGTFSVGTTTLNFVNSGDTIRITISDGNGGQTTIEVPAPVY